MFPCANKQDTMTFWKLATRSIHEYFIRRHVGVSGTSKMQSSKKPNQMNDIHYHCIV